MEKIIAAVDIGGTKTAVGLFTSDLTPLQKTTFPTEPARGCRDLVVRIRQNCLALLEQGGQSLEDVASVGVACPGPLDLKTGRIVHIPTMGFRDEPLRQYLEEAFGKPVALENDTNAAARAESRFGRGKGLSVVVYITVSTGVGCGIVIEGKILDGSRFAAGELGHLNAVPGGRPCGCGNKGCLEQYASGTAIAAICSECFGRQVSAKEAFALARAGDATALNVIGEAAGHLGRAIAALYQILDPDVVVLGGSVTKDFDVFGPLVRKAAEAFAEPVPGRRINVCLSGLGEDPTLLGVGVISEKPDNYLQANQFTTSHLVNRIEDGKENLYEKTLSILNEVVLP